MKDYLHKTGLFFAFLLILGGSSCSNFSGVSGDRNQPIISEVASVTITVRDLDQMVEFFTEAFDARKTGEVRRSGEAFSKLTQVPGASAREATMKIGKQPIVLREFLSPEGRDYPADTKSNDLWFQHIAIIVSDMDKAYEHVRKFNIKKVSPEPVRLPDWNKDVAGIKAFYFKGPEGHNFELLSFPSDKGDPKWHKKTDKIFLGIDHTAIGVSNTAKSEQFYEDALALEHKSEAKSWGKEHSRLSGLPNTRLEINSVKGKTGKGIGIEFLEYITPKGGRKRPSYWKTNDLATWSSTLVTSDIDRAYAALRAANARFITPEPVTLRDSSEAFIVRDPDGHSVMVIER